MSERLITRIPDENSSTFCKPGHPRLLRYNQMQSMAHSVIVGMLQTKRPLGRFDNLKAIELRLKIFNNRLDVGEVYTGEAVIVVIAMGSAAYVGEASIEDDVIMTPKAILVSLASVEIHEDIRTSIPASAWVTRKIVNMTAQAGRRWNNRNAPVVTRIEHQVDVDVADGIDERGKRGELW